MKIGRKAIIPVVLTGLALASAMPRAVDFLTYKPQEPVIARAESGHQNSSESKAYVPILRPAKLQEIGGYTNISKEYAIQLCKYIGQEMGYPFDPSVTIDFLREDAYRQQVERTPNSQFIRNSVGFVSPNGMQVYIKDEVEPYKLLGLVLNETAKAEIAYLQRQGIKLPSGKMRLQIVEAAAFAYQAAAQKYLEQELGFESFFEAQDYYERNDLEQQILALKSTSIPSNQGFLIAWNSAIETGIEDSNFEQSLKLFNYLIHQDDNYAVKALNRANPQKIAEAITARKGKAMFESWNFYDDKLP